MGIGIQAYPLNKSLCERQSHFQAMNKNLVLSIASLLFCGHVMAGGWGQLSGKNAQGQFIVINDETRSGKHAILVSGIDGDVEHPFRGACSFDLDESAFQPPVRFFV